MNVPTEDYKVIAQGRFDRGTEHSQFGHQNGGRDHYSKQEFP